MESCAKILVGLGATICDLKLQTVSQGSSMRSRVTLGLLWRGPGSQGRTYACAKAQSCSWKSEVR